MYTRDYCAPYYNNEEIKFELEQTLVKLQKQLRLQEQLQKQLQEQLQLQKQFQKQLQEQLQNNIDKVTFGNIGNNHVTVIVKPID